MRGMGSKSVCAFMCLLPTQQGAAQQHGTVTLRMSPLCVGLLGYRIMVIFPARGRSSIPGSQPDMGLLTGMLWGLALCMASTMGIGNMASEHDGDGLMVGLDNFSKLINSIIPCTRDLLFLNPLRSMLQVCHLCDPFWSSLDDSDIGFVPEDHSLG